MNRTQATDVKSGAAPPGTTTLLRKAEGLRTHNPAIKRHDDRDKQACCNVKESWGDERVEEVLETPWTRWVTPMASTNETMTRMNSKMSVTPESPAALKVVSR